MLRELARPAPRPSHISDAGKLVNAKLPSGALQAHETSSGLTLETDLLRLEIKKDPFALWWVDKTTRAQWGFGTSSGQSGGISWVRKGASGAESSVISLDRVTSIAEHNQIWTLQCHVQEEPQPVALEIKPITPGLILVSIEGGRLGKDAWSKFHLDAQGPFFGLGEQYIHANLAGVKMSLHPNDRYGTPGHTWDYMSIPFIYGPHGLGVYFDTALTVSVDFTQASSNHFDVQIEGPTVDCYLFAEKGPAEVLEAYTGLTGRTPLAPPWAFGVWHNSLQGADAVLADARRLRAEGVPVSALWVSDMMDDATNLGWPLWTIGYYGEPSKFNDELHNLGFKVLGYVHPYVRALLLPYLMPSPAFQYAVAHHFLVVGADGKPAGPRFEPVLTGNIDFTNPNAVGWWGGMIRRILTGFHFDGWMEDFGEWVRDGDRFAAGRTGRVMATLNPLFYHKITFKIAHEADPDAVEFSRSGAPGSQAFTPVLWGGDQLPNWSRDNGLPAVVTAGITAGLSGFDVWGPDILSSGTSKELWIRWMEFGALTPIMRDHLWNMPKFAVDLWFDSETLREFRDYARLHISLFPYFYTFAQQASRTGLPIIRHLMLSWPNDPNTYTAEYEYLLGDRILVAPVIEQGATTRQLYLPEGSWADYWTGKIYAGGREVTAPAPLHQIPLFVQAGALVPFISPQTETLANDIAAGKYKTLGTGLTWRVFPSSTATTSRFELYNGARANVEQDSSAAHIHGESPIVRAYEIDLAATASPKAVQLNGETLSALDAAGYRARKLGWWIDRQNRMLRVLFTRSNFDLNVSYR